MKILSFIFFGLAALAGAVSAYLLILSLSYMGDGEMGPVAAVLGVLFWFLPCFAFAAVLLMIGFVFKSFEMKRGSLAALQSKEREFARNVEPPSNAITKWLFRGGWMLAILGFGWKLWAFLWQGYQAGHLDNAVMWVTLPVVFLSPAVLGGIGMVCAACLMEAGLAKERRKSLT